MSVPTAVVLPELGNGYANTTIDGVEYRVRTFSVGGASIAGLSAESIDPEITFRASRYGKGDSDDYLNCPFTKDEYLRFHDAVVTAEKTGVQVIDPTQGTMAERRPRRSAQT